MGATGHLLSKLVWHSAKNSGRRHGRVSAKCQSTNEKALQFQIKSRLRNWVYLQHMALRMLSIECIDSSNRLLERAVKSCRRVSSICHWRSSCRFKQKMSAPPGNLVNDWPLSALLTAQCAVVLLTCNLVATLCFSHTRYVVQGVCDPDLTHKTQDNNVSPSELVQ